MEALKVLDTDVFIDHFRGLAAATAYIQSLPVVQRATTDVTVMELYKGAANREQLSTIERFLTRNRVTCLPVSAAASQRAVTLLHAYGLAHGLGIPDALIAVITLEGDHTLVTSNLRHFRCIAGLRVLQAPYRRPQPDPTQEGSQHESQET
jgi:predicted nucleic acid-binding protein